MHILYILSQFGSDQIIRPSEYWIAIRVEDMWFRYGKNN